MKKKVILSIISPFLLLSGECFSAAAVSVQQFSRINSPILSEVSDTFIGLEFDGESKKRSLGHKYKGEVRMMTGDQGALYSVSEAYLSKRKGSTTYSVGRKIIDWSPNEKYWSLGLWNSNKSFSHLEQEVDGVTAFHFDRKHRNGDISFFMSGINIPQLNPGFKISDGKVAGRNEWSNPPPEFIKFSGSEIPIYYDLKIPPVGDIVFQESIGLRYKKGFESWGFQAYAAWKPENTVRMKAQGYFDQSGAQDFIYVRTRPIVAHHIAWGGGFAGQAGNVKWNANIDGVKPQVEHEESFKFEGLEIDPAYYEETYFTTSASVESGRVLAQVHYLKLLKGDISDNTAFSKKPRWRNALGGMFEWRYSDALSFIGDYKYDLNYRDNTLKAETRYKMTKHTRVSLGLETVQSPKDESFWLVYRGNDSIFTNLSYRF